MKYNVVITEGEDGWYVVECLPYPGASQGKTVEEALENIRDAIQGCLDVNERTLLNLIKRSSYS